MKQFCQLSGESWKMFAGLEIKTQVFVEYQSDGTWAEVCKDRIYSRVRHQSARKFVPVNQRPNPELVRVQDADVDVHLVVFFFPTLQLNVSFYNSTTNTLLRRECC